jgi:two-component system NtrC family sensor kinase
MHLAKADRVTLRASTSQDPLDGSARIRITSPTVVKVSATVLPRIFEPFFTTKGSIGNGLGLWVCKQIIEKHGGTIKVRSRTNAGHGTTFSMVLPE